MQFLFSGNIFLNSAYLGILFFFFLFSFFYFAFIPCQYKNMNHHVHYFIIISIWLNKDYLRVQILLLHSSWFHHFYLFYFFHIMTFYLDPDRFRFTRQTTFGRRHMSSFTRISFLLWIVSSFSFHNCDILPLLSFPQEFTHVALTV